MQETYICNECGSRFPNFALFFDHDCADPEDEGDWRAPAWDGPGGEPTE